MRTMLALLLVSMALAEVPPMSDARRHEEAETIVVGRVTSVTRSDEKRDDSSFVREILMIGVEIETIEKGTVRPGQKFSTWVMKNRPAGNVGPSGQATIPTPGDRVRLFTTRLNSGTLSLLQPNGCDILTKAATQPTSRPTR
jgi:hypothetical protein